MLCDPLPLQSLKPGAVVPERKRRHWRVDPPSVAWKVNVASPLDCDDPLAGPVSIRVSGGLASIVKARLRTVCRPPLSVALTLKS